MKRILVAIDGSPRQDAVLAAATQLAEAFGAQLVLYRALAHPSDLPREVLDATDARMTDRIERAARADLEGLAARLPTSLVAQSILEFSSPWRGICAAARAQHADLVVIGAHGYGPLERMLGTTAARVVDHAERNVFVVRSAL